eukprot:TRINITY_DN2036_c0_g3_i1.p1 TRINITY_DN2036_c0_g3~~TRINITY_DN2036_c0_g3_i1.p1  ORF type:complete len:362 (-),score=78.50 TRINITY_DN2036_c0_g3_i1:72-1157(-)
MNNAGIQSGVTRPGATLSPPEQTNGKVMARKGICDVWTENFEEEMTKIMRLIDKYPYVAFDTEYPGIVFGFEDNEKFLYKTIKCNVDELHIIQIGLTLSDENGKLPPDTTTWQFNFRFDLKKEKHVQSSINLLREAGLNFDKHATHGIDPQYFAELFTVSNLPFNEDVRWITFHGSYDFAYLLRMLLGTSLPANEADFYQELSIYFPTFYDVKQIVDCTENLKIGSLAHLGSYLDIKRVGQVHQAGSDSLMTLLAFFKLKDGIFRGHIDHRRYANVLYGLNGDHDVPKEYFATGYFQEYHSPYLGPNNAPYLNYPQLTSISPAPQMPMYPFYAPEMGIPKMPPGQPPAYGLIYNGIYAYQE